MRFSVLTVLGDAEEVLPSLFPAERILSQGEDLGKAGREEVRGLGQPLEGSPELGDESENIFMLLFPVFNVFLNCYNKMTLPFLKDEFGKIILIHYLKDHSF